MRRGMAGLTVMVALLVAEKPAFAQAPTPVAPRPNAAVEAPTAAPPPVTTVNLIDAYTSSFTEMCYPGDPKAPPVPRQSADLNGDKLPDTIIDAGRYDCPPRKSLPPGTPFNVTVFLGVKSGLVRPNFQKPVFASRLQRNGDSTILWLTVGGADCGSSEGNARCERKLVWSDTMQGLSLAPMAPSK